MMSILFKFQNDKTVSLRWENIMIKNLDIKVNDQTDILG